MIAKHITVGIVDDDCFCLHGLKTYIEQVVPSCSICWLSAYADQAIQFCQNQCPDVLLIDMYMSGVSGIKILYELRRRYSLPIIIAITSFPINDYALKASTAGAQGIVGKNHPETICAMLSSIANGTFKPQIIGDLHFDDTTTAFQRLQNKPKNGRLALTNHETEIIKLCSKGMTNAQIAKRLFVETCTVETILRRVFKKLNVTNRSQLITTWLHDEYLGNDKQ